jgi:sigma-B regulation protein RsbU (phosphoserine phosphatase)
LSISATAGVAIANAGLLEAARRETAAREVALRQRDQVAIALQQSLLPPELPQIPGLELGAQYHAGTELVGGDFYDVFQIGENVWGIVLGDVCGSGPEAASQTALTRHTVRTAAMFDSDPATVISALNRALLRSNTDRFTTAVYMRLTVDPERHEVDLTIASGGHPPVLIQRRDGTFEESAAKGQLLGVTEIAIENLHVADERLSPGDVLVLYTDGLTEARSAGTLLDVSGVKAALRRLSGEAPPRLAEGLIEAALAHAGGPLSDDTAIVIVRVSSA